ncbi:MAG: type II secretion system GspH family protein [Actinomycetota bacterium]|nr:type II secretion system GspH family protein [Actinomycetota bacterium]
MKNRLAREDGFSLAEILITIVIISVTFTAILGGLMTSITVSSLHRKEATADALARDGGEWVKSSVRNPYSTTCAGSSMYTVSGLTVPSGYAVNIPTSGGVLFWNGTSSNPVSFGSACPAGGDKGLQKITIVATSTDGSATETVEVMKRSAP